MYGLLDKIFINSYRREIQDKLSFEVTPYVQTVENSKGSMICFLPSVLFGSTFLGSRIINSAKKKRYNVIAFKIPSNVVQPDPSLIKKQMDLIYNSAKKAASNVENLIVVGGSIGCCPASRLAASTGAKTILIIPGSKLAECIFESHATKVEVEEAKKLGFKLEDFQKELEIYNPIRYVSKLNKVYITIGTKDLMITSNRGWELVDALKKQDLDLTVKIRKNCDHSMSSLLSALSFDKILKIMDA